MTPRDRAFAVVQRMKAVYKREGCDWQREIEAAIASARLSAFEEAAAACRETRSAYAANPVWDAAINACARAIDALAAKERTP